MTAASCTSVLLHSAHDKLTSQLSVSCATATQCRSVWLVIPTTLSTRPSGRSRRQGGYAPLSIHINGQHKAHAETASCSSVSLFLVAQAGHSIASSIMGFITNASC